MHILTILLMFLPAIWAEQFNYTGYKVYRVYSFEYTQQKALAQLQETRDQVEFWSHIRRDGHPVDVMVNPNAQQEFLKMLEQYSIKQTVLIDDVEKLVVEERWGQLFAPRLEEGGISFTKYHRHDEINAYLDRLAEVYPEMASVETIGLSTEGRELKLIKISTDSNAYKPIIFIDAGIHAREWIAPPVALYAINQLVENPENRHLLEKVDWHIIPVANPDGYEYTHTAERFWRKTRSPGALCYGTDGNRNFDYHWAEKGSSYNECMEDYHGKHAFSEPETIALRDYIYQNKDQIKLYLTFHSYGSYILHPWGFTSDLPENANELHVLGEAVARKIYNVSGTRYVVGSSTNVLYAAAGGSDDWVKGVAGVALSYTIELPGAGWGGFNPPPRKILPVVTETWEGLKAYHHYISNMVS